MPTLLRTSVPVAVVALAACCTTGTRGDVPMQAKTIEAVLREQTRQLMSFPGVVGTAQGLCNGKACIKVYVATKTPELEGQIPDTLEGYPVVVEETGEFRPLPRPGVRSPGH